MMRKAILKQRHLLMLLSAISLIGCVKEEWDLEKKETQYSTIVEGTILSTNGEPLDGVDIKVDYHEGKWLQYSKTRHKAETKTDKNGKYRLHFLIKEDEQRTEKDKELSISKSYSLIFDLKNLNPEKYILPQDMAVVITSVDPPIGELIEDAQTTISYGCSFERSKTYTENLYIPQKRYIQITLKGFVPQYSGDYHDSFEVGVAFPYGGEHVTDHLFPDTKYGYAEVDSYLFTLYAKEEETFKVPFALNENNIIKLNRRKDGVYSIEEHQLFVTKESPESLVYEY